MNNERIIATHNGPNNEILEIVEVPSLNGAQSTEEAMSLYFIKEANATLKFIRVKLNGGSLTTEAGALYYTKGKVESNVDVGGVGGVVGKMFKNATTREEMFNPVYTGIGQVVLEPTYQHYLVVNMNNESFVVDKGLYFCSIGDITVSPQIQKNASSAFLGKDGMFQTKVEGTGICVLQIPIPKSELEIYRLENETLQVDGNFVILRDSSLDFSVRKSTKSIIGTLASGEGLLNTFTGNGIIILAPTAPVYRNLRAGGMAGVNIAQGGSNNRE